ncbi:hypothetical protein [Streptomyces scopuliridis]|uniref:hypothetical protein n=1 Tax=Streptomyces scopuliridis TaxID=452529 RepID=UPI00343D69EA
MDKLDTAVGTYSKQFGLPIHIWWRSDIDARVDTAPTELNWAYSDMLAGQDRVRYLIDGVGQAAHDHALRTLAMKVIATQWDEEAKVKFKQAELTSHRLEDLFIDVEALRLASPTALHRTDHEQAEFTERGGATDYLLTTRRPFTLVRSEPGQGKSTLGQYLCQLHRAAYLGHDQTSVGPRSSLGPRHAHRTPDAAEDRPARLCLLARRHLTERPGATRTGRGPPRRPGPHQLAAPRHALLL